MSKKNIVIGIIITIIAEIVFVISPLILEEYINLNIYYSLGQLFFDILLIPIAIIGFVITYNEYKKSQFTPDLKLRWDSHEISNDQLYIRRVSFSSSKSIQPDLPIIVLSNVGKFVSNSYTINLTISHSPRVLVPNLGKMGESWTNDSTNLKSWHFTNLNMFSIYPEQDHNLCSINYPTYAISSINNPFVITVEYTIYSDKSSKKTGTLEYKIFIE
jgi:hypothetical protein